MEYENIVGWRHADDVRVCNIVKAEIARQEMYVWRNIRRFSATIVAVEEQKVLYSECVSVVLGNQHAMRNRHIVICGLSGSTLIFHITS
jgi:hypothetical protein